MENNYKSNNSNSSYECRISSGYSNNGYTRESGYREAEIIDYKKSRIRIKYKSGETSNVDYINLSNSFFNSTMIAFFVFFIIALGFNLVFYLLVPKSEDLLIMPKIILSVFLLIGIIPIIVNIVTSFRKVRFDLNSNDYLRVIFKTRFAKKSFLREVAFSKNIATDKNKEIVVNVSYGNVYFSNAKILVLSKKSVQVEGHGFSETYKFTRKNHGTLRFLYLFFGVFLALPFVTIFPALANGTFEKGLLSTILFGVVGLIGMFVPTILNRGDLFLYCIDKKVHLKFKDSKTRRAFEKTFKYAASKTLNSLSNTTKFKINAAKSIEILDESPRLENLTPFIVIITVCTLFWIGVIASIILLQWIVAIVLLVMSLIFFSIGLHAFKDDLDTIRARMFRKRALRNGYAILGEIVRCQTKLFIFKKRTIYDVHMLIEFTNEAGFKTQKILDRKYSEDKKFCVGQTVIICSHEDAYFVINCEILSNEISSKEINAKNKLLFEKIPKNDEYDVLLQKLSPPRINLNHKTKLFEKPLKLQDYVALIGILPFLIIIFYAGIGVLTHQQDDKNQIILAIIFLATFGSIVFIVFILSVINFIKKLYLRKKYRQLLKTGNITYGYITDLDKHIYYVRTSSSSGSSQVEKVKYLINYKYQNLQGKIITISFVQDEYAFFANSYDVGEKIIVVYDKNLSVPIKNDRY